MSRSREPVHSAPARLPAAMESNSGFGASGALAYKDKARVWVGNVEFGHAVFAIEQIPNAVTIFESFHMLPQFLNARDFDVYFGVVADAVEDLCRGGALQMDGLPIALDD